MTVPTLVVLGGLLACGRGGPSTSEPPPPASPPLPPLTVDAAVAGDADLVALIAATPDTAWRVGGGPTKVGDQLVVDVELKCMMCSPTCESISLGPHAPVGDTWRALGRSSTAHSSVVAAQPNTGEVALRRTVPVDGVEAVGWPEGLALTATLETGDPVPVHRSGDVVWLVAEGPVVLEGGGPAPAGTVVSRDEVVMPARALGLHLPAGPNTVRVKALPTMAMAAPLPTTWDGDEVVVAYHRAQTVTGEGARLQGIATPDVLTARLAAVEAARVPGLESDGAWLHYTWAGAEVVAAERGLVLPRSGGGEREGWALRALAAGATPRLRASVIAWARGKQAEPACFGVVSMPVASAGPAGASVLAQVESQVGRSALLEALTGAASWPQLLERLPAEVAESVREDVGLAGLIGE